MISIVVTERERLGVARTSFLSILDNLEGAQEIVYVGGKLPLAFVAFLRKAARGKVRLKSILEDHLLMGNQARRVGLDAARKGNGVVFVQNDVIVRKGWLSRMVLCAKRTGAEVVVPLVLEGAVDERSPRVHDAGAKFTSGEGNARRLVHLLHQKERREGSLRRQEVDVVEFHCFLANGRAMEKALFDQGLGDLSAHLDFSLECRKRGMRLVMEPRARVVFANPCLTQRLAPGDLERFLDTWGEGTCRREIDHMAAKWGIPLSAHYLWEKRAWAVLYKEEVLASLGGVDPFSRFLWRSTRTRRCPEWVRTLVEKVMVARVRAVQGKGGRYP